MSDGHASEPWEVENGSQVGFGRSVWDPDPPLFGLDVPTLAGLSSLDGLPEPVADLSAFVAWVASRGGSLLLWDGTVTSIARPGA